MRTSTEREFLDFVAAATPALFRTAYALTGQQHAAEDLLQSALERVAARWRRIDDPAAYARRVMYHEQISWWRRWKRREVVTAAPPDRAAPDDPAQQVALRHSLRAALDRLGPRQRAGRSSRWLGPRPTRPSCSP